MIAHEAVKQNPPRLIVNADDYGHTPQVSQGIRDSHRFGIVTSTTAMMNMPGVEEALVASMQECPRLGLGVHLILTTGAPVLPASQAQSLVTEDNTFPGQAALHERLSCIDLDEVEAEWGAQVEKFLSVTGRSPDHLDAHHHIAYVSPGLLRVMLALAQKYACAIRLPTGQAAEDILSDFPADVASARLEDQFRLVEQYRPRHPDHFLASFYGENAHRAALIDILDNLPSGATEIMCHPGYTSTALGRASDYHAQREDELAILTDHEIIAYVQARNIELINFGDL